MPRSTRRDFFVRGGGALALSPNALLSARPAAAPPARNVLSAAWPPEKLASVLLPREKWKPFPTAADRAAWEALPQETREALVSAGAARLGSQWTPLPATLFLEYARNGNRSNYERVRSARRERLRELVIAECVEGKDRFLDEIVNGIWTTCEETFWGVPAHLNLQKARHGLPDVAEPVVDLFAAETAALLAWTEYLLGPRLDKVSPLVRERIRLEIERRILRPNLERIDFWWMGLDPKLSRSMNNWNPWINSNWLTAVLLLEPDQRRRVAAVHKILRSLDRFLDSYHEDGGCDEGPGYWNRAGGSLFDCLELLHSASGGAIHFYKNPLVSEIGRYIYRAHIFDNWYVNFADASAQVNISGDLVFRYGRRIGDPKMEALGSFAAMRQPAGPERAESIGRQLPALFNLAAIRNTRGSQPLVRDVWLPGIQVMAARLKEGSSEGLYLAAQGGHNAESHNHNDVGNFIVYADGRPAIIDVGVETYTAKTFSSRRYEIWTMQSAYHNLPTIDGLMQMAGREFAASDVSYRAGDRAAEFSLDIAKAYPREAGLKSWKRTLRLDRERNEITVGDSYAFLRSPGRITLTLMTPCRVSEPSKGELLLASDGSRWGSVKVLYDASALAAAIEEVRIEDRRLQSVWGDRIYRILLKAEKPPATANWAARIIQVR